MNVVITRTPWREDFPDVVIHGDLQRRNRHPNLAIAKAGNAEAALALVRDLLSDAAIGELEKLLQGRKPVIIPVTAIEMAGFNAIPDAMAQEIGERLKLAPLPGAIMQSNKVAIRKQAVGTVWSLRRPSREPYPPASRACWSMTISVSGARSPICRGTSKPTAAEYWP